MQREECVSPQLLWMGRQSSSPGPTQGLGRRPPRTWQCEVTLHKVWTTNFRNVLTSSHTRPPLISPPSALWTTKSSGVKNEHFNSWISFSCFSFLWFMHSSALLINFTLNPHIPPKTTNNFPHFHLIQSHVCLIHTLTNTCTAKLTVTTWLLNSSTTWKHYNSTITICCIKSYAD